MKRVATTLLLGLLIFSSRAYSDDLRLVAPKLENKQFSFQLTGTPGQLLSIETSSNITDWTASSLCLLVDGPVSLNDGSSLHSSAGFYRAKQFTGPGGRVNALSYINVQVPPGHSMIANQLYAGDSSVRVLFRSLPEGTTLAEYNSFIQDFTTNTFEFGEWSEPEQNLLPGEGAIIYNPTTAAFTITFVGQVLQGSLVNPIPVGLSIRSSMIPRQGQLVGDLQFPVRDGDKIYRYEKGELVEYLYQGGWANNRVPALNTGESFMVFKATTVNWTIDFQINNP